MNDPIQISGKLINRLASVLHELRPDWDEPGCVDALSKAKNLAACVNGQALALAAVRAAGDTNNRTPKVIALDGQHWRDVAAQPKAQGAFYGPSAVFCQHLVADEDDGRSRKCLMVVCPGEVCTHSRPRRTARTAEIIASAKAVVAASQGAIERTEGAIEQAQEKAREDAA